MGKNKICLAMIVKNEEQDIQRCLDSVKDHIDYWVISDTGSEDNTKQLIQEVMDGHGIPGELHEHKWEDFSTNRNYVLELAKEHGDFVWFMDADDNFVTEVKNPLDFLDPSSHKGATLNFSVDGYMFTRACIVNPKHNWRYHGVLHEILMVDSTPTPLENVPDCLVIARSSPTKRAKSKKEKYENDAKILLKEHKKNPSDTRTLFYLAQSYRDSGHDAKAIKYYKKRLDYPEQGFKDELEIAAVEVSKAMLRLKKKPSDIAFWTMKAWQYNPYRIEAPIVLMEIYMIQEMYFAAFTVAQAAAGLADSSKVYLHKNDYDSYVRFPAHYAYCCYMLGLYDLAVSSVERVLSQDLDEEERKTHEKHLSIYKKCLDDLSK